MKTKNNYQPEDIEALLAEKAFHELYAEEKAFVLEHLASAAEYEQMRETLLAIRGAAGEDEQSGQLRTSPRVKADLMAAFEEERKKRALIWWNSLGLFLRTNLRFDLPVVRFAFAAVVLLLGIWFVFRLSTNEKTNTPALVKNETAPLIPQKQADEKIIIASSDSVNQPAKDPSNLTDEVEHSGELQPAPQLAKTNPGQEIISADSARSGSPQLAGLSNLPNRPKHLSHAVPDVVGPYAGFNAATNNFNSNFSNNIVIGTNGTNLFSSNGKDTMNRIGSMADKIAGNTTTDTLIPAAITLSSACCGGTTNLTSAGSLSYNWAASPSYTNGIDATSYTVTVSGSYTASLPKSRSLASDANAISLFCELK